MNQITGQIIRAFSPAIGKYRISENLIESINSYVDTILEDQNKIETLYHGNNLAGEIKYEFRLTKEFINLNLYNPLKEIIHNYSFPTHPQ